MNTGSCLCSDVSWEIDGEPTTLSNCHCSMCRKLHGSAFGTYATVAANAFRWTSGEANIQHYESSPGASRPFCPRCGSKVATPIPDRVFMPAGNLDGDIARPIDQHFFVASKAPWYDITGDAPQFDECPEDFGATGVDTPERLPETDGAIGGSCLCGAVAFEFDETTGRMGYCHCSRCRKSRSAAHSAQTFVAVDKFGWLRGDDQIRNFKLPESQFFIASFCKTCASMMPTMHEDRGVVRRARSTKTRASGHRRTSTSVPRRPGSRLPTSCCSSRRCRTCNAIPSPQARPMGS